MHKTSWPKVSDKGVQRKGRREHRNAKIWIGIPPRTLRDKDSATAISRFSFVILRGVDRRSTIMNGNSSEARAALRAVGRAHEIGAGGAQAAALVFAERLIRQHAAVGAAVQHV